MIWQYVNGWLLAAVAAASLLCSGCTDSLVPEVDSGESYPVDSPSQASWEEQVEQVRAGESDEIVFEVRPVDVQQWQMLARGCDRLQRLEVDTRFLTASDLELVSQLPQLSRLRLRGPVDDAAMSPIARAEGLTVLNLPDAVVTDAGLARLEALDNLELLRLSSPHVTDVGMAVIRRLPSLRFLHLIDVPITDEGLRHLHGLKKLESFYLDGGRCTEAGLYQLLEALPELHFHRNQLHLPDDPRDHSHG